MQVAVVRRPVVDAELRLVAYRFLYADVAEADVWAAKSGRRSEDEQEAHAVAVATAFAAVDFAPLERLRQGMQAYVPLPVLVLARNEPVPFGSDQFGLQVPSEYGAPPELVETCGRLRDEGWRLGLDYSTSHLDWRGRLGAFDYIEVDFGQVSAVERKIYAQDYSAETQLLASNVASHADFEKAQRFGYALFEGPFLTDDASASSGGATFVGTGASLGLLQEVTRPELDVDATEDLIKRDPELTLGILRYINSASFALRSEITSIRQAIVLMGENEFRKWVSLFVISDLTQARPHDLMFVALVRARLCELVAPQVGLRAQAHEAFLTGLLSNLDAVLGTAMEEALGDIPVAQELKEALLGRDNALRRLLLLVLAYEQGHWAAVDALAKDLRVDVPSLQGLYMDAMNWAIELEDAVPARA